MISYAKKEDIQEVKELFDLCFFEEPEFNKWFFEKVYDYTHTIVYKIDNKIVAMLQALPYEHSVLGKISYIYGACTHLEYRKRGYMQELIQFSFKEDIKNKRNASVLIPANKGLFDFYKKFGYNSAFYIKDSTENRFNVNTELSLKVAEEADIEIMLAIYEKALKKPYIIRDYSYFKTQMDMFNFFGGKVYLLKDKENVIGYCFINIDELPFVQELITIDNDKYLEQFKALIFKKLDKEKIRFVTIGDELALGCIKYHNAKASYKGYMNLMFN